MMLVACVSLIYSDNLNLLLIEKNFIGFSTLIIFFIFLRIESKCSNPFFPVKLLLISSIRYISIGSLVFGLTAGIIFSASPLMFIREAGYPIDYIGLICTAAPIGVILSVFGRKVINSSCNKIILIYALPLMLFAFALLFFVSFNISIFNYVIAALCYGLGGGLFQGSLIQIAMDQKKDKQSTIGGLLRLFQNGGIIIGSACSLMLLEAKISPLENISTYQKLWGITFSVLSIMFVYSYVSLFRIKNKYSLIFTYVANNSNKFLLKINHHMEKCLKEPINYVQLSRINDYIRMRWQRWALVIMPLCITPPADIVKSPVIT